MARKLMPERTIRYFLELETESFSDESFASELLDDFRPDGWPPSTLSDQWQYHSKMSDFEGNITCHICGAALQRGNFRAGRHGTCFSCLNKLSDRAKKEVPLFEKPPWQNGNALDL